MYYKFNNFIGRITSSTQTEAYSPQGFLPLAREPSVIIFDSKKTKPVHESPVTRLSSTVKTQASSSDVALGFVPATPRYQRIMRLQTQFLKDDGKLVWQKMGARDRAGYLITIGLCLVGSGFMVRQIYQMAFPRKVQD